MVEEARTPAEPRPRRSLWWRLFFAGLGLLLLFGLGIGVVGLVNRARLARALHEIEQRGEPVVLPDVQPTVEGAQSLAWLQKFDESRGPDGAWMLADETGIRRFLGLPEAAGLTAENRALLEALADCKSKGARWSEDADEQLSDHALALLLEGQRIEALDDCVREFVLTRGLAFPRLASLALRELPHAPLDPEAARGIERLPQHIPWMIDALRGLLEPVPALATRGRAAEVVDHVEAALRLHELCTRKVGLVALSMREVLLIQTLLVIRIALAQLPPDVSLERISSCLGSVEDEHSELRRALIEERAMGNEVYDDFSLGRLPVTSKTDYVSLNAMSFDQLYFLAVYEDVLRVLDHEPVERIGEQLRLVEDGLRAHGESRLKYTTIIALMILPRFRREWETSAVQHAWRELSLLGLRVRNMSPEAALAEVARTKDPLATTACHARLEADGLLTIWSVGLNGRDDGAPSHAELDRIGAPFETEREKYDDLVLRVRPR